MRLARWKALIENTARTSLPLRSTLDFFTRYNDGMPATSEKIKKRLFVIAGTISVGIGVIGIFLPVLPTTPFLLLAAICYTRGSQRLYKSLLYNRFIGTYIRNYLEGRGMSLKMKVWTISLLWITIVSTAVFATESMIVRIILAVVLIGVTFHILLIRTIKKNSRTINDS